MNIKSLRLAVKASQEQADNYALVYWREEDCVSVVELSKFLDPSPVVGESCQVQVRKKIYKGVTVKIGT